MSGHQHDIPQLLAADSIGSSSSSSSSTFPVSPLAPSPSPTSNQSPLGLPLDPATGKMPMSAQERASQVFTYPITYANFNQSASTGGDLKQVDPPTPSSTTSSLNGDSSHMSHTTKSVEKLVDSNESTPRHASQAHTNQIQQHQQHQHQHRKSHSNHSLGNINPSALNPNPMSNHNAAMAQLAAAAYFSNQVMDPNLYLLQAAGANNMANMNTLNSLNAASAAAAAAAYMPFQNNLLSSFLPTNPQNAAYATGAGQFGINTLPVAPSPTAALPMPGMNNLQLNQFGLNNPFDQFNICKFFLQGTCTRGNECNYLHLMVPKQPTPPLLPTNILQTTTVATANALPRSGLSNNSPLNASLVNSMNSKANPMGNAASPMTNVAANAGYNAMFATPPQPTQQLRMPSPQQQRLAQPLAYDPNAAAAAAAALMMQQPYAYQMSMLPATNMPSPTHHLSQQAQQQVHHHHQQQQQQQQVHTINTSPLMNLPMTHQYPQQQNQHQHQRRNSHHANPNAKNNNANKHAAPSVSPIATVVTSSMDVSPSTATANAPSHTLPPHISELVTKFTTTSNPDELCGHILEIARDQFGCRLLQRMLDEHTEKQKICDHLHNELYGHMAELMTDPFGNYLAQKIIEKTSDFQREQILGTISAQLVNISLNVHGTRAVQRLVESVHTKKETQLVIDALKDSVVTLIKDLNGNHVIQRCLHRLNATDKQFIYDAITECLVSVATHKHGCCVLQRTLDYGTPIQQKQLINEIIKHALELVQDCFGNYVVSYIIMGEMKKNSANNKDNNSENDNHTTPDGPNVVNDTTQFVHSIVEQLLGRICILSTQKFSSPVIEKCLMKSEEHVRSKIIDELIMQNDNSTNSADKLSRLLQDPFANYVLQTALSVATQSQFERMALQLKPHLLALKHTTFGKRIQNKIAKKIPGLLTNTSSNTNAAPSNINSISNAPKAANISDTTPQSPGRQENEDDSDDEARNRNADNLVISGVPGGLKLAYLNNEDNSNNTHHINSTHNNVNNSIDSTASAPASISSSNSAPVITSPSIERASEQDEEQEMKAAI